MTLLTNDITIKTNTILKKIASTIYHNMNTDLMAYVEIATNTEIIDINVNPTQTCTNLSLILMRLCKKPE